MVHVDDFVDFGDPDHLESTKAALSNTYKIKTGVLGSAAKDAKELRAFDKMVRMTDAGIELEVDPRHAELVVGDLGLEKRRPSRMPGARRPRKKLSTA